MRYALTLLVPLALYANARAETPETLVVTATRTPTKAETIPAGVTVIDAATIRRRGYVTLVDALSAVPGLRVVQSGGPGAQASVFVRGTNSNHVLVLLDGVPINDPADPGGAFNFGEDRLDDVEKIEIVRGPMSALYGTGAIGGVINIITKPATGRLHGDITLAAGLPRQGLVQAHASGGAGIWDYAVDLGSQSAVGFDQIPQRESVYTGHRDGTRGKLGEIDLGVTPVAGTRISLLLRARDTKSGFADASGFPAFDSPDQSAYDAQVFGRLALDSHAIAGFWDTQLFVSRLQDDRRYTNPLDPLDPNQYAADDRYHGHRTDAQWNNVVHLPDAGGATATALTLGYEHASDTADAKVDEAFFGFPYISAVHAHDDSDAGSLGVQTTLWQNLAITAAAREDATTASGDASTWRAGAVLALPALAAHLHAAYGTGFRAPSLFDRYGVGTDYTGNPALRPERSQGWEIGVTEDLAAGRPDFAQLRVTYFDNRIRNLIELDFARVPSTPVNLLAARSHGIEAGLSLHPADWLSAEASYTYTDARDLRTGALLLRRPENQASLDAVLTPWPNVSLAPELLYVGRFADYLVDDAGYSTTTGMARSGVIFNMNASWKLADSATLFIWGKNLGGSRFEPASGYQLPGASFLAGARFGF